MASVNADRIQQVIGDDLFPTVSHVSDVKQVLEFMEPNAQPLRQEQLQAILYLQELGNNKTIHPDGNPYKHIIDFVIKSKNLIADPEFFLDTIEALIPKPPKPILMSQNGEFKKIQASKGGN